MRRFLFLVTLVTLLCIPGAQATLGRYQDNRHAPDTPADDSALRARVMQILKQVPLIDGHNDVPWQYRRRVNLHVDQIDFHDTTKLDPPMHTDLTRLRAGGLGGQFWSVYVPAPGAAATRRQAAASPRGASSDRAARDGAPRTPAASPRDAGQTRGGAAATTSSSPAGAPADSAREVQTVFEQIDFVHRLAARYPDHLEIALTADDVVRIHKEGKIASMMGMEGGHSIGNSLGTLRQLYAVGARYMTLTHSRNTRWADSANDEPVNGGLSRFGEEVVREMNRLGMLVDLSHVSPATMHDALDVSEAPVIFSHSSALGRTNNPRNVPDDVLKRLKENGGVAMVTFFPAYVSDALTQHSAQEREAMARLREQYADAAQEEELELAIEKWQAQNPAPWPTLSMVADHIDHVREVAGIDHIGIGSDFDGMPPGPVGLEDVSKYPDLFVELLKRGYSDQDIRKIAGENILRVMREAERVAARLQSERPPSDATLEELDTAGEMIVPAGR
jgi:membrane dipeptidase